MPLFGHFTCRTRDSYRLAPRVFACHGVAKVGFGMPRTREWAQTQISLLKVKSSSNFDEPAIFLAKRFTFTLHSSMFRLEPNFMFDYRKLCRERYLASNRLVYVGHDTWWAGILSYNIRTFFND